MTTNIKSKFDIPHGRKHDGRCEWTVPKNGTATAYDRRPRPIRLSLERNGERNGDPWPRTKIFCGVLQKRTRSGRQQGGGKEAHEARVDSELIDRAGLAAPSPHVSPPPLSSSLPRLGRRNGVCAGRIAAAPRTGPPEYSVLLRNVLCRSVARTVPDPRLSSPPARRRCARRPADSAGPRRRRRRRRRQSRRGVPLHATETTSDTADARSAGTHTHTHKVTPNGFFKTVVKAAPFSVYVLIFAAWQQYSRDPS